MSEKLKEHEKNLAWEEEIVVPEELESSEVGAHEQSDIEAELDAKIESMPELDRGEARKFRNELKRRLKLNKSNLRTRGEIFFKLPRMIKAIYGEDNKSSIIQYCPKGILYSLRAVPMQLLNTDESTVLLTIRQMLGDPVWYPNETVIKLRENFWMKYEDNSSRVTDGNIAPCDDQDVYRGVTTEGVYHNIISCWEAVAWIITPPHSYITRMESALAFGITRLRDILALPILNREKEVDHKTAELIIKTTAMLDMRMKGAFVQTSIVNEKKTISITNNNNDKQTYVDSTSIDDRIKELEDKLGNTQNKQVKMIVSEDA